MVRRKIHLSLSLRLLLVNLLALALGVAAIGIAYTYRAQKFSDGFSKIVESSVSADGRNPNQAVVDLFNQINTEGIVFA